MSEPAVRFEAISKLYGGVTAVDAVSFDIAPATLVTLLGPSGCGKTTTLRMIAGLEQPSSGRILIAGQDVTNQSAAERDVSMVFQSYALFPHMNVLDNVCYGLRASGISKKRAAAMATEKLASVGLEGFGSRLPSELSGGQQQRVAVARAIVLEPKVLLFDEPLSNLDAKLRRRVREDIRNLQQSLKLTVVYVTHDQEEALAVSDRVIVMRGGVIVQDGAPRALYEEPESRFIADFIGNANVFSGRIEAVADGIAEVRIGSAVVRLPARAALPGVVEVAVRPQAIRLTPGAVATGEIEAIIVHAAYLGSFMEYRIAFPAIPAEALVTDADVSRTLAAGTKVSAAFLAQGASIIPA